MYISNQGVIILLDLIDIVKPSGQKVKTTLNLQVENESPLLLAIKVSVLELRLSDFDQGVNSLPQPIHKVLASKAQLN